MDSLIGISVRGKTFFFPNTLSNEQLHHLKQFANNYQTSNPTIIKQEDSAIIEQFILDANKSLNLHLHLLKIKEILIIK